MQKTSKKRQHHPVARANGNGIFASNLLGMASNLIAMASTLVANKNANHTTMVTTFWLAQCQAHYQRWTRLGQPWCDHVSHEFI